MSRITDLIQGMNQNTSEDARYEDLLHVLFNGISDFVFCMEVSGDSRFTYVHVNRSAQNYHQVGETDWIGRTIDEVLNGKNAAKVIFYYNRVVETGESVTYEDQMTVKNYTFFGHTMLSPLKDQSGRVTHIVAITRDITERVEKERELSRMNDIYRSVVENTADAMLLLDTEGRIREANPAFETMYGWREEQLLGHFLPSVTNEDERDMHTLINRVLRNENVSAYETVHIRKNGERFYIAISLSPVHNHKGEIIGLSSIIRNINERKRAEQNIQASRSRYQSLFQHSPHPIFSLTLKGLVRKVNQAGLDLLNADKSAVKHTSFMQWTNRQEVEDIRRHFYWAVKGEVTSFQTYLLTCQGESRLVAVSLAPIIEEGTTVGMYAILQDETDKHEALVALTQSEEKYRLIADHCYDLLSVHDSDGTSTYISPSHQRLLGRDSEYLLHQPLGTNVYSDDQAELQTCFAKCIESCHPFTVKSRIANSDGNWTWYEYKGTPILQDDGRVQHVVMVGMDITKQIEYEAQLEEIAFYDYLTELPNRRLFEDRMKQSLAHSNRHNSRFAVLYMDGDSFKAINDEFGHDVGDEFLREVGQRLTTCVREGDTVARIGGDEFAIIVNELNSTVEVQRVAERVVAQLRATYECGSHQLCSSFSIGIACYPEDGKTANALMKSADIALYYGKQHGKGSFHFYHALEKEQGSS
ncbi:PAS domain S-box protein [Thalassobacillus sp. CUG 92003]|uniref:PAS domain S-box protein n=1 Tax=Thalassobacillus sp. CUG 92003 TaxID=2736641 RepID=UPI0015E6A23B|nr:PAS domain S-box protein [Thalassobacillus sp. CUG 92003]